MRIRFVLALALLVALAAAADPAHAQRRGWGPKWEFSVLGGFRVGGNFSNGNYTIAGDEENPVQLQDLELENGPSFTAIAGYNFTENGQVEASWARQRTPVYLRDQATGSRDELLETILDTYHVSALYRFGRFYDRTRPWLGVGLGTTRFNPAGAETFTKFSWGITFGTHIGIDSRWAFRLQGRLFSTYIDQNSAIFCGYGSCWNGNSTSFLRQFDFGAGITLKL